MRLPRIPQVVREEMQMLAGAAAVGVLFLATTLLWAPNIPITDLLHAQEATPQPPPPAPVPPSLTLDTPAAGWTTERIVPVAGTARGLAGPWVTLVVNGVAQRLPVRDGRFASQQVLAPGENRIAVFAQATPSGAEAPPLELADEVALYAVVPPKDLRVTLGWDTHSTDVDLHVVEPDGFQVYYGARNSPAGGSLDTDVTTGFGPETYSAAALAEGEYRVDLHYYGDRGLGPSICDLELVLHEGTPAEQRLRLHTVLPATGERVTAARIQVQDGEARVVGHGTE